MCVWERGRDGGERGGGVAGWHVCQRVREWERQGQKMRESVILPFINHSILSLKSR